MTMQPKANTFMQTLLSLENSSGRLDLFSRALLESLEKLDWDKYGFRFTQVFESDVLEECALLAGLYFEDVLNFNAPVSARVKDLRDRVQNCEDHSLPALVNLASILVCVSRFSLASKVLRIANGKAKSALEIFETAWVEFLISNRVADGAGSQMAFARMQEAVASKKIPSSRVLDMCTQGVVWFLKRKEVSSEMYAWCVDTGKNIATSKDNLDVGAVSAWYRGFAMVPAAARDPVETRAAMERALDFAVTKTSSKRDGNEMNLIKTYYESAIKEFTYVSPSLTKAVSAAHSLIELDPLWSLSHGELAEVYIKFGKLEEAADHYAKAVALGVPYYRHHLLALARCNTKLNLFDLAKSQYTDLLKLAPQNALVMNELRSVLR